MDIAQLSMNMSQQKILDSVGTAMLSKSLDFAQSEGAVLSDMIGAAASPSLESLVNPAVGGNIDFTV